MFGFNFASIDLRKRHDGGDAKVAAVQASPAPAPASSTATPVFTIVITVIILALILFMFVYIIASSFFGSTVQEVQIIQPVQVQQIAGSIVKEMKKMLKH
jgi:hypothetical protein